MLIDSAVREKSDTHEGDERRFVVVEKVERIIIPRELKEQRAAYVKKIEEIDASLALLESAGKESIEKA